MTVDTATVVLAALFGLLFGSFLNVCITRWPAEQSVVSPRSRCPRCGALIAWYDNIPVVSWLALRARCRHCGLPIPVLYPAVELAKVSALELSHDAERLVLAGNFLRLTQRARARSRHIRAA